MDEWIHDRQLTNLVVLALVLNVVHGIEVSSTWFYRQFPNFYPYTKYFSSIPEAVRYMQHAALYLAIAIVCLCMMGKKRL